MSKGKLILVPTPLNPEQGLPESTFLTLKAASERVIGGDSKILFVGEDAKPSRARWVKWGMPRDLLNSLLFFNENDTGEVDQTIRAALLQEGTEVYLFSDGGMPAFCDPGAKLVAFCHNNKITVTATSCDNSVVLALALSGHDGPFYFASFPPKKDEERESYLKQMYAKKETVVLMDTPYRLGKLMKELCNFCDQKNRQYFLALDLNNPSEQLLFSDFVTLKRSGNFDFGKREFVLILKESR